MVYSTAMVLHARFNGKVLIPEGPVELPTARLLEVEVREPQFPPRGSAQHLLEVIRSLPPLEPGDTDALMREIEAAQKPAEFKGIFDEQTADDE